MSFEPPFYGNKSVVFERYEEKSIQKSAEFEPRSLLGILWVGLQYWSPRVYTIFWLVLLGVIITKLLHTYKRHANKCGLSCLVSEIYGIEK